MANYKVAYGRKENMNLAIERGIIPPGCIVLTEDSNEIYFYDLSRNLRVYGVYDVSYVHTQSVASNRWEISHNLNKYPSATIVDSSGSVVVGEIKYINANSLVVTFAGSFSGKAYLN